MFSEKTDAFSYKIHWHVILTHFPISFFVAAFMFQLLHLFMAPFCFELATNAALLAAIIALIPTILSGWFTWHNDYKGIQIKLFHRKIVISFTMLGLSTILALWRFIFFGFFAEARISPAHYIYLAGNTALIFGAIAEGFLGARLNHK